MPAPWRATGASATVVTQLELANWKRIKLHGMSGGLIVRGTWQLNQGHLLASHIAALGRCPSRFIEARPEPQCRRRHCARMLPGVACPLLTARQCTLHLGAGAPSISGFRPLRCSFSTARQWPLAMAHDLGTLRNHPSRWRPLWQVTPSPLRRRRRPSRRRGSPHPAAHRARCIHSMQHTGAYDMKLCRSNANDRARSRSQASKRRITEAGRALARTAAQTRTAAATRRTVAAMQSLRIRVSGATAAAQTEAINYACTSTAQW